MIMNNSIAPMSARNAYLLKMMLLCAVTFAFFFFTGNAHADIFSDAKVDIIASTAEGSALYMAITALSLIIALITGITTKNWFGAVGGFAASMIFLSVGMSMVFG